MSVKRFLGAALLACVSATGALQSGAVASAQEGELISNPRGLVDNFNLITLESMMRELGVPSRRSGGGDGSDQYLVIEVNRLNVLLAPAACNEGKCGGLDMVIFFTDHTASMQGMLNFNRGFRPAKIFVDNDGDTHFARYLIADYGYTRGSFMVNLGVFVNAPDAYFSRFAPQSPGANQISFNAARDEAAGKRYRPGEVSPTDAFAEDLNAAERGALAKIGNLTTDAPAHGARETSWRNEDGALNFDAFPKALGNQIAE